MQQLTLKFGDVDVPFTKPVIFVLWMLYLQPHQPVSVASILNVKPKAARMRVQRAAERLGTVDVKLAVTLREHVHWTGGIARYTPALRKM